MVLEEWLRLSTAIQPWNGELRMNSILRLTEATVLAFHAVQEMGRDPNRPMSTRSLAETLEVSEHHLAKVHQRLTKRGLLVGERGPHGGFHLARPSRQISLLEVFEAMEGPFLPCDCLLARSACNGGGCVLADFSRQMNQFAMHFLSETSVADLARSIRGD